jgi:hypothetical protein
MSMELVACSTEVIASTGNFELAGDVGQIDEHRRICIAEPHDVHQELLVVGVANHLVEPHAGVTDGSGTHAATETNGDPGDEKDTDFSMQPVPERLSPTPSIHRIPPES